VTNEASPDDAEIDETVLDEDSLDGGLGETGAETGSTLPDAVRLAVPLGVGLIIGVFLALGIQGDVLSRLIRDHPTAVAWAIIVTVLGLTLPLILSPLRESPSSEAGLGSQIWRWLPSFGGALVMAGAIVAVNAGTEGVGDRENPDITIVAHSPAAPRGKATLTVTSTALNLASSHKMLLRVVAIPNRPLADVCDSCRQGGIETPKGVKLAYWGESGPDGKGAADAAVTLSVNRKLFRYLCVYSALSSKPESKNTDRLTIAMVDLRTASSTPNRPAK